MPKAERGTTKDIANRIKAKGLQKLKFYCQMCQKQCRDANGFKCHMTSENHLRNMKIFAGNANGIMDNMSKEFEKTYVDILRRRHGTKRVNANTIYQEVIQDRHHIHMNATKWSTLSIFVQYLGRMGKCIVDETERGWYVQYIERDASILQREENLKRRKASEKVAEKRYAKQMEIQRLQAAKIIDQINEGNSASASNNNNDDDNNGRVEMTLNTGTNQGKKKTKTTDTTKNVFGSDDEDEEERPPSPPVDVDKNKKMNFSLNNNNNSSQKSKFEGNNNNINNNRSSNNSSKLPDDIHKNQLKRSHNDKRECHNNKKAKSIITDKYNDENSCWLVKDIIVRIITEKKIGGVASYYLRKGVINRVVKNATACELEVLDTKPGVTDDGGDILLLDQDDLETVIPKKTREKVRIVQGKYKGCSAKVVELQKSKQTATLEAKIKISDTTTKIILDHIPYEYFSKVF